MLKPDIWLAQHNEYYDLEGKRERAKSEGIKAWIDPEGYRRFIAEKKRAFEDQVDLELGVKRSKSATVMAPTAAVQSPSTASSYRRQTWAGPRSRSGTAVLPGVRLVIDFELRPSA